MSATAFFVAGAATVTNVPAALAEWVGVRPEARADVAALPQPLFVVPTSPEQWFQPAGRNQGTEEPATFLAALALHDNPALAITDRWGRTVGDTKSDHHVSRTDSWAVDLAVRGVSVPTQATETAAVRIASALGHPGWTGGNLVVHVDGYRFQLLWKVAGHFDHVHIGVRRGTG
ncbi:MAG: hypothetical protein ACLGI2_13250 [Acidimicrobiia bacterium]